MNSNVNFIEINGKKAKVGNDVKIGYNVIIYPNVEIKDNVIIGDNVILGKIPERAKTSTLKKEELPPLIINERVTISSGSVICSGTSIGAETLIGDGAFIREKCVIGSSCLIGRAVTIENDTKIGNFVKIQAHAYITAYMNIEDYVFIAPCAVTTNDNFMGRTEKRFALKKGAHIKKGARIGANAILLPGITIGKEAFIAAGSIVTKDVPDYKLVKGIPARVMKDVPPEEWVERQKR